MFVKRKMLIRYTPDPEQRVSQRLPLGCRRTGVFLTDSGEKPTPQILEAYEINGALPTQNRTVLFVHTVPIYADLVHFINSTHHKAQDSISAKT